MTDTAPINSNTRALARSIANDMMSRGEIPSAERVRAEITRVTNGVSRPSTGTVQSEMKAWFEEDFWPTWRWLEGPTEVEIDPKVQTAFHASLREIFAATFQRMALGISEASDARYAEQRAALEADVARLTVERDEAKNAVIELTSQVGAAEVQAAADAARINNLEDFNSNLLAEKSELKGAVEAGRAELAEVGQRHTAEIERLQNAHQETVTRLQLDVDGAKQVARREAERAQAETARATAETERAAATQKRADELAAEVRQLSVELAAVTARLEASQVAVAQATEAAITERTTSQGLLEQLTSAKGELARLSGLLEAEQAAVTAAQAATAEERRRGDALLAELADVRAELARVAAMKDAKKKS